MLSGLTYNIYFGRNIDQIITWLNSFKKPFDILCFQEFPEAKIKYLQRAMKSFPYDFSYASSFIFKNESYGELTLVHKEKLTLKEHFVVSLGTNIIEEKILRLLSHRTALVTQLCYNTQPFLLSNTHLIAFAMNMQRREQLRKLFGELASGAKEDIPAVVLGDMNYSSLLSRKKLFELIETEGFANAYEEDTHNLFSLTSHQLDYIFNKQCTVQDIKVIDVPFSDHFPVQFTLGFAEALV